MRKVDGSEMESRMGPADVSRPLTDALGATDVAINYYELVPGESTAYGYHVHSEQEEVFYALEGTITFETGDGEVTVQPGEAVRFGPGEYHRSHNAGDERAVVLAIGAPKEAGETEILVECPDCGEYTPQALSMADDRSAIVVTCEECGTETDRHD